MPDGVFYLSAVIQKELFLDTFTRTDASSWGPDYTVSYAGSQASVDGSVGRIVTGDYWEWLLTDSTKAVSSGSVQYDFYVPADVVDFSPYTAVISWKANEFRSVWFEAYQASGSNWSVDIWAGSTRAIYTWAPTASTWYRVRFTTSGFIEGPVSIRLWKVSDPEPTTDQATGTLPSTSIPSVTSEVDIQFAAPDAEQGGFDNFRIMSFGPIVDPTVRRTFGFNAVKKRLNVPGSFILDAEIVPLNWTFDAWIINTRSWQHDRQLDHFGTELDTVVVIDGPIGKYPSGTTVHDVLLDMVARINALEDGNHTVPSPFTLDAFILPHFWLDAVLFRDGSTAVQSFTLDARTAKGTSFAFDAFILFTGSFSWTFDAFFIDDVCL